MQTATYNNGGPGYPQFLTFQQTYGYDGVNRINSANDTGGWSRAFQYDPYGNMWVTANSGVPLAGNTPAANVYTTANRISGGSYDADGNQTVVNGNTLAYDAENRQVSETDSVTHAVEAYLYDGDGRRVEKTGPGGTTVYVYDVLGQLAAEYSTANSAFPCATCYLSADHLGSTRLVTDASVNVIARHDYLPFGEEIPANTAGRDSHWGPGNDTVNQKFTGKERDAESGLDFFQARYYGAALGRFTRPDWSSTPQPIPYGDLTDPQTLNQYAYVRNNPLSKKDPDGHCTVDGEDHGWLWCAAHTIGLVQTQKEQADTDRQALSQMHGFTIGGQTPADIAKNGTNQQVIGAYNSATQFLLGVAQQSLSPCGPGVSCGVVPIVPGGALSAAAEEGAAAEGEGIVAQNGTKVNGFTAHGINRAIGDDAQRAGTRPEAILDALRNPQKIVSGVDQQGRPYQIFTGKDARVVINPATGNVVSVNPLSGAGAH